MQQEEINRHRSLTFDFLETSGVYAVRVKRGDKAPESPWQPSEYNKTLSNNVLAELRLSNDNVGGLFHGNMVDIDIDNDNKFFMAAVEKLLPPCSHVWGRKSKPRSHRAYMIKNPSTFDRSKFPILRRLKKSKITSVEVRGGKCSDGLQSVLPGSLHKSQEYYTWHDMDRAKSSPTVVDFSYLIKSLRLASVVALIAPYWVEGSRNDLTMSFAGLLYRVSQLTDPSDDEHSMHITREIALDVFTTLLDVASDDEEDRHMRLKTFEQTWTKGENGANLTGGTTIQKITGDKNLIKEMYSLLTDNESMDELEAFLQRFVVWQGPGLAVDLERLRKTGDMQSCMSKQNFVNSFGHMFIEFGEGGKKLMPEIFWHLRATTRVAGMTFDPSQSEFVDNSQGLFVNQWSGFAIPPFEGSVLDEDVDPFVQYMRTVVCDDDDESYKWVVAWLSSIFKEPANKPKTALVLVGEVGAGKTFLGEKIIGTIVGGRHSIGVGGSKALVRDFNSQFDNKLFVRVDESTKFRDPTSQASLLNKITEDTMIVEYKGKDVVVKPNHARFMFTSNKVDSAINIDHGLNDRRFTVLAVSDWRAKDVQYWDYMHKWVGNDLNLSKVHKWLLQQQYDRTLILRPLFKEAKKALIRDSIDIFDDWLIEMVNREFPLSFEAHEHWWQAFHDEKSSNNHHQRDIWPLWVDYEAITKDFSLYAKRNKFAKVIAIDQVVNGLKSRQLLSNDPGKKFDFKYNDDRVKRYYNLTKTLGRFPPRVQIQEYLMSKYGMKFDDYKKPLGKSTTLGVEENVSF
jgi:Family of unknown function (DUF5906)/Bifunctional DNA primase/polymerase, N-terminal